MKINDLNIQPAYRLNGKAVPMETFYQSACDPRTNVVVEACAGSGKTWTLVSRCALALLDGAKPNEILAITYTRKAAGEMRERLSALLTKLSASQSTVEERVQALMDRGVSEERAILLEPELATLHERVLSSGRAVEVRTFHAWFAQLLRGTPRETLAELNMQPGMSLIEDNEEILPDVFRRFYKCVLKNPQLRCDLNKLISDRGRSQTKKWLETAIEKRVEIELADAAGTLETSVAPAGHTMPMFEGMEDPADVLLLKRHQVMLSDLAQTLGGQKNVTPQKAAQTLREAIECSKGRDVLQGARDALMTKAGTAKANLKTVGVDEAVELLQSVERACHQQDAHLEHLRMVRLTRTLLAEYMAFKSMRGLADMADLEKCAQTLLSNSELAGWVQERLDAKVRHILIDEFQDTSPLQWRALESWLSGYAGAGGGQRPPVVFIVGDPKQSIYRFRRAEPRVFMAAKEFVRGILKGSILECDHTRRNDPSVLAVMNCVFEQATEAGEFTGFRRHTTELVDDSAKGNMGVFALQAVSRNERGGKINLDEESNGWRNSLETRRVEKESVLRQIESDRVAKGIALLVKKGHKPGSVMVLSRKRASLSLVANALQTLGIPYVAADDGGLGESPAAQDLVAIMDVLASPRHNLSLARALKSPAFSVDDDGLVWVAERAKATGRYWLNVLTESEDFKMAFSAAPESSRQALARAGQLLKSWVALSLRIPPHDLLDAVISQSNFIARVAAALPDESRAASMSAINALVQQALELDGGRYATNYKFVRAMKAQAIKVPKPSECDAVQLLTVHSAKGLEAESVFIMDCTPESQRAESATLLVDWKVDSAAPEICAFVAKASSCPPSLVNLYEEELLAREREELNSLYVAITRARERVVLSQTEPFVAAKRTSWGDRIGSLALHWDVESEYSDISGQSVVVKDAVEVMVLPSLNEAAQDKARSVMSIAAMLNTEADRASSLGKAIHRVMQWATPTTAEREDTQEVDIGKYALAACKEFSLDLMEAGFVEERANTLLNCQGLSKWLKDGSWEWAGNEVPIFHGGEMVRLDRVVAIREGDQLVWWILDYKMDNNPQEKPGLIAQLEKYRAAVRRIQPGDRVRAAFITGDGRLEEVQERMAA